MDNTDFTESVVTVSERRIGPMWLGVPEGVKHIRDIEFQKLPTRSLLLDIFMPEDPPAAVPVILWISGGGWRGMTKDGAEQVAAWICAKGFAVVGLQYRVSSEARFPAQIQDCKAALRWVRAEGGKYRLDGARVGVWGDSAGGHLAALLGVSAGVSELEEATGQSTAVSAVCAFNPPKWT